MAEAVVERADVLASLGPVLVHLCMPGPGQRPPRHHRELRPSGLDRPRPQGSRDPSGDPQRGPAEQEADRPNVTSLQGEARASDRLFASEEDVIRLPDLEAEEAPARRAHDATPPPS